MQKPEDECTYGERARLWKKNKLNGMNDKLNGMRRSEWLTGSALRV